MRKIYLLYEHTENSKYIVAAGYSYWELSKVMFRHEVSGPIELVEVNMDEVDAWNVEEKTMVVEGGALNKAASFRGE